MKKQLTLCMVCSEDKILLGFKKRGFGEGKWNGFGGKVDQEESIEVAASRELKEEVDLESVTMDKVGIIDFSFESDPQILQVHIFKITDYIGEPKESEEMKPQ
jgi:8-oxo-dGTP diphosphatase/2-hydroxy-dATP diphosphatase